ncbi:MAG: apolipoprotein N-acyltransferase [Deltaproteobacteria bacterium]|nr:apolipoprotein N-acyltransferase [Deltaproteobacteria bacterium]
MSFGRQRSGSVAVPAAAAFLSGCLCFLGFVGFGLYPLAFVAWVPVLWATRGHSSWRVFGFGVIFGWVTNVGGFYWVGHLLEAFAGAGWWMARLGLLGLCLYQGVIFALALVLVRRAQQDFGLSPVWTLPVAFPAMEFAYPQIFPNNYGVTLYVLPVLTQIVEVFGVLALSALIGLANGAIYELVEARVERRALVRSRLWAPCAIFLVVAVYGLVRIPMVERDLQASTRHLRVALVQTNIGGRERDHHDGRQRSAHLSMSLDALERDPSIDLFIWPESAYDGYIDRRTRDLPKHVTDGLGVPVIFGGVTYHRPGDGAPEIFNTAVLTSSTGAVKSMFDKTVLLAFGETLPLVDRFPSLLGVIRKWFPRTSVFTRGTTYENFDVDGVKLMPMICYEDIIPSFVRTFWVNGGAPDALVNITNDSWYGDSHEPLIHLVLASFRALETRRPLIRSTNTGISAIVDPVGRITTRTKQWEKDTLVESVPMPMPQHAGTTPYVVLGDVYGWASLITIGVGWSIGWRRRRLMARGGRR